jgi:predicted RNase H-like HicB family nuclease
VEESAFTPEELAEASRYRLVIQWSDEDGLFLVSLPEFGGIRTHATTITGAAERGVELAAEWIDSLRQTGRPVPAPQSLAVAS